MTDLYLKFVDEAEADSYLKTAGGDYVYPNTDVLGIIYNLDYTDPQNPVAIPELGWHVNLRVDDYDPALDAFRVNPEPVTWRRMWL